MDGVAEPVQLLPCLIQFKYTGFLGVEVFWHGAAKLLKTEEADISAVMVLNLLPFIYFTLY